ncbi:11855_t:CDS:1, partial [Racocetra fulgida]
TSTEIGLNVVIELLKKTDKYIVEESFDCAWSHVYEASQASEELIFNEYLEDN